MTFRCRNNTTTHGGLWIRLLFVLILLSLATAPAAAEDCVDDLGGLLDGFITPVPPSQIQIDGDCTIRNFTASNPLTTNFSFYTQPGNNPERWLLVFDNVVHTGQMACNSVQGHKIWFVNGSSSSIQEGCQNLLIPVEKIDKQNPAGQTTAAVGVPFTYRMTIPILFEPASGTVINESGSPNDLHSITIWDDLNATGVDLTYLDHNLTWLADGSPVPHTFTNVGGMLTFDEIPIVPSLQQVILELTVVLNDTPVNVLGTQFINTAKWDFGRLIEGVFYEPLPGEWGVTAPMTIGAPELVVTKTGPAAMNLGQWGDFNLDVRNTGLGDAWDVHIQDLLPDGATGGMCDQIPEIQSIQVFGSDGITPIPGKNPLTAGSDYSLAYSAAPDCRMDITMLTAAGAIGPDERLIVRYRTRLDPDTQNGIPLTNVSGAIGWFNGDGNNPDRQAYSRTLTDGSVGTVDHEDAHTTTVALSGYFFEKTVANLTSGADPASTAGPGDTLRYTLRLRTTNQALNDFSIHDEPDVLNASPVFSPGTLALVEYPAGADIGGTDGMGGANGTGVIDIRNLDLPAGNETVIRFDITLEPTIDNGTVATNQSTAYLSDGTVFALSDDPGVNGMADPDISGDEDPTRVTIVSAPEFVVEKISTDLTDDPNGLLAGDTLRYTITVNNIGNQNAVSVVLRDSIPADTAYVAGSTTLNGVTVSDVGGLSPLVNGMLIHAPSDTTPGTIPADPSGNPTNTATITFEVVVDTDAAIGTVISNQGFVTASGSGIINQPSDDPDTPAVDDPTLDIVTVGTPELIVVKSGPATMNLGQWGDFVIDIQNIGLSDALNVSIQDRLPDGPTGGMCSLAPEIISAQVFSADGITPVPGKSPLAGGIDYLASYSPAPDCLFDIAVAAAAGSIGRDERLIIRYRTQLDTDTQNGIALTNVAGAIQWLNEDSSEVFSRTLTDGTTGTADHQDAHTVVADLSGYIFEKTVENITTGISPATTAGPGDTLRYTLRLRTTDQSLTAITLFDEMDALNAQPSFVPDSLTLVAYPSGADIGNTSGTGGANGTGVIDIRDLDLPASSEAVVRFDITLDPDLTHGTVIANQSTARFSDGTFYALSDDPNVNGTADPDVSGDEDPTRVTVVSAPIFVVQKISTDLTGNRNVLNTGDTLRYTITVKNTGNLTALDTVLRDAVPANTTYVPGSTVLNGVPVADVGGLSPLIGGMPIHAPSDPSPGTIPADASGDPSNTATVTFDVVINPNVVNGTVISNQGFVSASDSGIMDQPSDDPNTPAVDDPTLDIVTVLSSPSFVVQKISTDLTGDPDALFAGDTLRYTITVKNIGTQDAFNAVLRDAVPANTSYVAGSTTLNSSAVADISGLSPLVNGMQIHSESDPTPGFLPADPSGSASHTATITFDVIVDPDVVDGTVISNQGFVSASDGGIVDQPSDDPDTPAADDPTKDIVGNLPLLYAEKSVELFGDLGSPGIVDPGDTLRYTITVQNSAATSATGVVLSDTIPANTTYIADSTLLNGIPVGQPDNGISPLASGIDLSSSDRTPPLPGPGEGTISAGAAAVLQFDVRVDAGTPAGTLISNQAVVASTELPDLPTDGDGDPATGPEPTVVVVGDGQQLSITKQVVVVGGGAAVAGAELEYTVSVANNASVPATNVLITDNLNASQPGYLVYVNGSATMNDSTAGVSFDGSTITADYAAIHDQLAPGEIVVLRFQASIASGLPEGTVVTNTGMVSWNTPVQTANASVSITVGGVPGFAEVNGAAWHDADFDDEQDTEELPLAGWTVEFYEDGRLLYSALTDTTGTYRIAGLRPNDTTGTPYELRFEAPGAGANTARLGQASSPFTNGLQRISDIVVTSDAYLQNLDLPIDPNGVVYNSVARVPIAGATLTLLDAGSALPLPESCFDDPAQQGQITLANGYYKFDVNFSDPASCPNGGDYIIDVTAPSGTSYIAGYSQIIPPVSDLSTAAFSVPACPGSVDDTIPGTTQYCEVQPSALAPAPTVPARSPGTIHHIHVMLDDSQSPGSSQIFNNHIPIDPDLDGSIAVSKTTPFRNVNRGQMVPYVIRIIDRFPAGFSYVEGSAFLDGTPVEPTVTDTEITVGNLVIAGTQSSALRLLLAVGGGVSEGEYVNRVQVANGLSGNAISGEATATVRVVPDPTFDCTDITGKVFNDANRNGTQDEGEDGIQGARVVTPRGLQATTDQYGRYHITCAITPNEVRGSNFVLKLDDRTLPSGFRPSTTPIQIKRATRGKGLNINFGASIYRVVGIDFSDAVFEPDSTENRLQWRPRLDILLDELRKSPSILRLSYIADTEDAAIVDRRVEALRQQLTRAWVESGSDYELTIESEVFWRRGSPLKRPELQAKGWR
ncbi:MAG: hypothetical protein P8Z37_04045 [Acidobacteriota bacterium]